MTPPILTQASIEETPTKKDGRVNGPPDSLGAKTA
jgi:hypothetical protein